MVPMSEKSAIEVSDGGKRGRSTKPGLFKKPPAWVLVCIVALVIVLVAAGSIFANNAKESTITTESQLEKVVNVSKLSSAKFSYNGIAVKKDDEGRDEYHVKYKSTVTASFSMDDIKFDEDKEAKKVVVSLPAPQIDSPVIDSSSLDFFESDPDADLQEVITLCKQDALDEVKADSGITSIATDNIKKTVEALTKPILEEKGYTLEYQEQGE